MELVLEPTIKSVCEIVLVKLVYADDLNFSTLRYSINDSEIAKTVILTVSN